MTYLTTVLVGLVACSGSSGESDSGEGGGSIPEVAGRYNMILAGTNGCEGESSWIQGWADGPVTIDQAGEDLTLDFFDDIVLSGRVTDASTYTFGGTVEYANPTTKTTGTLMISNGGVFVLNSNGAYEAQGSFEVEVNDDEFKTNNCTISGEGKATQILGLE